MNTLVIVSKYASEISRSKEYPMAIPLVEQAAYSNEVTYKSTNDFLVDKGPYEGLDGFKTGTISFFRGYNQRILDKEKEFFGFERIAIT